MKKSDKLPVTGERLKNMVFHVWRQFDDQYYQGIAAQIAYFFLMASVPSLVVLSQLLGVFDVSLDFIRTWIESHLDSHMSSMVLGLFDASNVGVTNVLLIALALWAASSLECSLARLTSYTISEGRYRFNFMVERFLAIPTALLAIVAIAFSLVIYVYGENFLYRAFGNNEFLAWIIQMKSVLLMSLFFVMILVNYYILPRIRVPLKSLIPGAVVATFGITIATWVYSMYIERASNYNLLYGSFANIIAMMLWFYIISFVICIGMMFNKAWDDVLKRNRLTPPRIKEYLIKASKKDSHILLNKYIDSEGRERDNYESIAVKASLRYVKGYREELEEKRKKDIRKLL
ncbi:MAG: YihY/virulence factor BrkB family protein [Firmicutes bacterium]|nr:YihY/virulence factor BrkB family protein [Bacillota bacterium]